MEMIDPVDGWTANRVDAVFSNETFVFRYRGGRDWILSRGNEPQPLTETTRTDDVVDLQDAQGNRIVLDLGARQLRAHFRASSEPWGTGVVARASASPDGFTTTRIEVATETGSGYFRQTGTSRWEEYGADGELPRFAYDLVERTSDTITMRDASRSISLTFDLSRMQSYDTWDGQPESSRSPITAIGTAGRPSDPGGRPSRLTITNPTTLTVEAAWVDFVGVERRRFEVEPGGTGIVTTYAGHRWVVRDVDSRRRLASTFATAGSTAITIATDDLRPIGGDRIAVTVKNLHTHPVDLASVATDGTAVALASLAPGVSESFQADVGDVFRCRSEGQDAGVVLVGADAVQYRRIERGPSRTPGATARFINTTPLDVAVARVDEAGLGTRFHTMAPGEQVDQPVVAGETWNVNDVASRRTLLSITARADDETFVVTTEALRSRRSDQLAASEPRTGERTVQRTFVNNSSLDCILHRVEASGLESDPHPLASGATVTRSAPIGTVWRVREVTTKCEIAVHIADATAPSTVDVSVRPRHSRLPMSLSVENRTLSHAAVFWLDGNGNEIPEGFVAPWGRRTYQTYATHVWLLREPVTNTLLDVHIAAPSQSTLLLDASDLARVRTDIPVQVGFHNQVGFVCEIVDAGDPTGPALASFAPGADGSVDAVAGQTLALRETIRGSVFATRTCGTEADQFVPINLVGTTHGGSAKLVCHNTSTIDLVAYEIRDGEHTEHDVAPWSERTFATRAGAVWLFCEARSGAVYACTMATGTPRRVEIDPDVVRTPAGSLSYQLRIHNRAGVAVEAQAMTPDGTWATLGVLAAGDVMPRDSAGGEVIRYVVPGTDLELDRSVTVDESPFDFEVDNHLVARSIGESGLRQGEVALYPDPDFRGAPIVVHCDIADLSVVLAAEQMTSVGSIRLGPATTVVLTTATGADDAFHVDTASFDGTDVAGAISGLRLLRTAETARCADRIAVDLVTSSRKGSGNRRIDFQSYRTVMTFGDDVDSVEVWATEQLDVYVGDRLETLHLTTPTVLTPTSAGTLTLDVPAEQRDDAGGLRGTIGTPGLLVRTNTMRADQRFVVYPDRTAMQRLGSKSDDDLWDDVVGAVGDDGSPRSPRSAASGLTPDACAHVMRALRQVASAAPGNGALDGRLAPVDARSMEFDAWALSRTSAAAPAFVPLDVDQAAAVAVGQTPIHVEGPQFGEFLAQAVAAFDRVVVRPVARETTRIMTSIDRVGQDVGTTLRDVGTEIDRSILQPVIHAVHDEIVQPIVDVVEEVVDVVGEVVDASADLLVEVVDATAEAIEAVAEIVLALTVEVGQQVQTLVIDTAEKVAATVTAIVEEVGLAIGEVVDFLATVLDWQSVKDTHDLIVGLVLGWRTQLTAQGGWLDQARTLIVDGVQTMRSEVPGVLAGVGRGLGAIVPADGRPVEPPTTPELPSPDWLIDRLVAELDRETAALGGDLTALVAPLASLEAALASVDDGTTAAGAAVGRLIAGIEGLTGAPPEQAGPRLLGVALAVVQELIDGLLASVAAIADVLFDALRAVIDAVFDLLATTELPIPIISDLYQHEVSGGSVMTPLGLVALLLAFPTSVVGRAVAGERWPVSNVSSALSDVDLLRHVVMAGVHGFEMVMSPFTITLPDPAPLRPALLAVDLIPTCLLAWADLTGALIPASPDPSSSSDPDPAPAESAFVWMSSVTGVLAFVAAVASSVLTAARPLDPGRSRRQHRRGGPGRRRHRSDPARKLDGIAGPVGLFSSLSGVAGTAIAAGHDPNAGGVGAIGYGICRTYIDVGATVSSVNGPVGIQQFIAGTGNIVAGAMVVVSTVEA